MERILRNYLFGHGVETSRTPLLGAWSGGTVRHLFREPDNLYRFGDRVGLPYESVDFVFNDGLLNETRFHPILLKEWFALIRVGGKLVVRAQADAALTSETLREVIERHLGTQGEILYFHADDQERFTVVVNKLESLLPTGDTMQRWSFVILNPAGAEISELVDSILRQGIPQCQILVNGPVDGVTEAQRGRVEFQEIDIDASQRSTSAQRKNRLLLCARHENVVILDRRCADLVLEPDWHGAMERYGNHFDALACGLVSAEGERYADWWTLGCDKKHQAASLFHHSELGVLEARDWDDWVFFADPVCILKRRIYKQAMWNIHSHEGDENTYFCHDLREQGVLLRYVPEARCVIRHAQYQNLARSFPRYPFDPHRRGDRQGQRMRRLMWRLAEVMRRHPDGLLGRLLPRLEVWAKASGLHRLLVR